MIEMGQTYVYSEISLLVLILEREILQVCMVYPHLQYNSNWIRLDPSALFLFLQRCIRKIKGH